MPVEKEIDRLKLDCGQTIKPAGTLTKTVVRGTAWAASARILERLMGTIRTMILARLLLPEDFGLFGIATISIATLNTFTEIGVNTALVQRKGNISGHLDTAWLMRATRGLLLSCVLFLSAPLIAGFFGVPKAIPLLRMMSLSVLVEGLNNIGIVYFQKELMFDKEFLYRVIPSIAGLMLGILLAYTTGSVWTLVFAALAEMVARLLMSYILHSYRPRFRFDGIKARDLVTYGRWIFASSITAYIGMQLDNVMVGKLLGIEALGLYALAYKLSVMPIQEITYTISRIAVPSYAKLQSNPELVRKNFDRVSQLTVFVTVPACIGLGLIAPQFVKLVLGEKWVGLIFPLQLLMIAQAIKAFASTAAPLFLGVGKPNYEFYMQLIRAVVLAGLLYPFIRLFDISGASLAVIISAVVMIFPFYIGVKRVCGLGSRDILLRAFPTLVTTIVTTCLVSVAIFVADLNNQKGVVLALGLTATIIGYIIIYLTVFFVAFSRVKFVTVNNDIKVLLSMVRKKLLFA